MPVKKEDKCVPKYEWMREAYIGALQTAWVEYVEVQYKYLSSFSFGNDGQIYIIGGEYWRTKLDEAKSKLESAAKSLKEFDTWAETDKKMRGLV